MMGDRTGGPKSFCVNAWREADQTAEAPWAMPNASALAPPGSDSSRIGRRADAPNGRERAGALATMVLREDAMALDGPEAR